MATPDHNIKSSLPTGAVTLLFTDIAGSSRLWEQYGDRFIPVWQAHDAILRDAMSRFQGYEVKSEGDAFMVAFSDPTDAVHCALYAQTALARYPWPADIGPIRVRMGLHSGEPFVFHNDYFGPVVNRAAYICKAAQGGQVLISEETQQQVAEQVDGGIEFKDHGEQRLKDMDTPQRLYEVWHPSLEVTLFPPPYTLEGQPNNLPTQRTSFVGRSREIEAIASFLAQGNKPILTLTGPGGIGKTRLSLQAAAAKAEWFPDGVWYVKLMEARDVAGAAVEIATAMRIPLDQRHSPMEQVREWLADRRCLLILDDANTIPQVDSLIRELLSGSTSLRCLATARESLQISGGDELALAGLSTQPEMSGPVQRPAMAPLTEDKGQSSPPQPVDHTEAAYAELAQTDAGRLFLERAMAVNPQLRLSASELEAAAILLRKLEGTPANIELAAQMMDRLTPSLVLQWLEQRLPADRVPAKSAGVQKFKNIVRGAAQKVSDHIPDIPRAVEVNLGRLLQGVAGLATERRDARQATELGRESLRVSRETGDLLGTAAALRQLAQVKWQQGDRQSATALLTAAAQLYRESNSEQYPAIQRELDHARELLGQSEGRLPIVPTVEGAVALALEDRQ
jgi:class 3 adenylate cyclase/predicted ATPase